MHFDLELLRNLREFEGSALFFLLLVYVGFFGALSALGQLILFFLLSLSYPCRRGQRSDRKGEERREGGGATMGTSPGPPPPPLLGARKSLSLTLNLPKTQKL